MAVEILSSVSTGKSVSSSELEDVVSEFYFGSVTMMTMILCILMMAFPFCINVFLITIPVIVIGFFPLAGGKCFGASLMINFLFLAGRQMIFLSYRYRMRPFPVWKKNIRVGFFFFGGNNYLGIRRVHQVAKKQDCC